MNKIKKVGIYLRVSSEEQARIQDGSLVSQRKRLEEYVEAQNKRDSSWGTIVQVYCDEGKSAKDMNRPEFQRLLTDVKLGKVNLILATELSRLSRSIRDFCELWDLFKKHSTGFVTLREQFDTTTASGEMMVFQLIGFAQYERKQTAERISANWLSRAKRGLWNGGTVPLGYDRNPANKGVLLLNPEESEMVKTIFKTFLETESVRKTCLRLNAMGIRSKSYTNKAGAPKGGGHFTVSTLNTMLKNKAYLGVREILKKSGGTDTTKASWPAIIDEGTFNQVQARLTSNKNRYKPNEWKNYAYPMTEKVVCGECGHKMGGKSAHGSKKIHHYYAHNRSIKTDGVNHLSRCRMERVNAEKMEGIVLTSLKSILLEPEKLSEAISIYQKSKLSSVPGLDGRLKSVDQDIRSAQKRIENLTMRLSDLPVEVSAAPIYSQIKTLQTKLSADERTRIALDGEQRQINSLQIDENGLRERLTRILGKLETLPADSQRSVFNNLIQYAEVHPTKVRLGVWAPAKSNKSNPEAAMDGGPSGYGIEVGCSTTVLNGGQRRNRTALFLASIRYFY